MYKGIILGGGYGTRLWPLTSCYSKHLMPIYDKPMIYYPLSLMIDAGIRDIAIITNIESIELYKTFFGNGEHLGINLIYIVQKNPNGLPEAFILAEDFINKDRTLMMLGDNLIYNPNLGKTLKKNLKEKKSTIYTVSVNNPKDFGVVELDAENNNIITIEEKPKSPKSNLAIIGLYSFDENVSEYSKLLNPSEREELEITDLIKIYSKKNEIFCNDLSKSTIWYDTGSFYRMHKASCFIENVQSRADSIYGSPEVAAFKQGFVNFDDMNNYFLGKKSEYALKSFKYINILNDTKK